MYRKWVYVNGGLTAGMGKMTPGECAAFLDERCNAAIDEGWAVSRLHE